MLYYVDRSYEDIIEEFVPKIPSATMDGENHSIPRICLCPTIEDCINAASWGHSNLIYRKPNEVFRVYMFDEKDIKKENYMNSNELWEQGLVPDAYITNEIWVINQKLKPIDVYYIRIGEYFDTSYVPILTKEEYIKEEKGEYVDYSNIYTWEILKDLEIIQLSKKDIIYSNIIKIPNEICLIIEIIDDFISKENLYEIYTDMNYTYFKFESPQSFDYTLLLETFSKYKGENYV